ncbi:bifunctional (p)ppGpp synthetase/guanosine-3',5'-bis(diphosphate) 3'-pyrophosphohydrolase [Polynucleobacter sp. AM-26B4]|nr:bifunctional (p)ppGpp synthetase/guanosine-3',5'-bis(diphosphate) 3'-pyrophosphohydrolase [Polynucleobacter sp. AM-26B4]
MGVKEILLFLKLDEASCLAAEHLDSTLSKESLEKQLGQEVAQLIMGYRALKAAQLKIARQSSNQLGQSAQAQVEVLRKMLLAFAHDLRVVLLHLASVVQTLRWVTSQRIETPTSWAQDILDVDAALANRLGIWQLKWEMEDLAFRCLAPDTYKQIASLLDSKRVEREAFIADVMNRLQAELNQAGIKGEVQGRPKHIYSIWKKMQGKSIDFAQLYDVRAFRIMVDDVKDCYAALGIVHHIWQPIPKEFDDYIARPKPNGYQSLHTVVMDADNISFEVQVRTHEMHKQAEYGVAAHWRYKEAGKQGYAGTVSAKEEYDRRIAWARQLIAWKEDAWDQLKGQELDDQIYVLTPLGQVVPLQQGATPIDFAYSVHTDLGHRCRGSRVDGAMVPLDTQLKNGQTVEIISVKQGGPSLDWLNAERGYLATNRAKSKVRAWFTAQQAEQDGDKTDKDEIVAEVVKPELPDIILRKSKVKSGQSDVLVVGVDSLLTQLSRCCRPVPPDPISGFVTRGRGVSIHRQDCSTFKQLLARAPERVVVTEWGNQPEGKSLFPVDLALMAVDRQGLLRDISEVFSRLKINVTGVKTQSRKGIASMQFTIEVPSTNGLQTAVSALLEVKGVTEARRK